MSGSMSGKSKTTDAKREFMTGVTTADGVNTGATECTVAVVGPSLDILGGQGVQADDLIRGLRELGHNVKFVPVNPRFPRGLQWLRKIPLLRTLLNQCLYIPGLVRLCQADVVHVYSASYWSFLLAPVPAMLAGRLLGKKVILNYHSGEAEDHLANWGMLVHPWLKLAHEIVVPSGYLREVFAGHGYACRVIRNTVDLSQFRFRERLPVRPLLLSVRNLESHYRVDNTLEAFALLSKTRPDARLLVAGYGSEEAPLKKRVASLGLENQVRFTGRTERCNIPALFDQADIFVNSSEIDNQPLSILEAFAAGLTVVTTPVGDIPNMVHDGVSGKLVACNDPQAMARAIREVLDQPELAARMARRGYEEVPAYTWRQIGAQWTNVYNSNARN